MPADISNCEREIMEFRRYNYGSGITQFTGWDTSRCKLQRDLRSRSKLKLKLKLKLIGGYRKRSRQNRRRPFTQSADGGPRDDEISWTEKLKTTSAAKRINVNYILIIQERKKRRLNLRTMLHKETN